MSGLLNKLKDAVSGGSENTTSSTHGTTGTGTTGTGTTGYSSSGSAPHTQGPHNTDAANKADPRVDSDGDGRAGYEVSGNRSNNPTGMGSGVGHQGTGIGKNTTSTPIFGSGDTHAGHTERQELENYENRHGHSSTGTGLGSNTGSGLGSNTGTGMGSSTGTGMGSNTGSGMGYGQNISGSGMGSNTSTTGSSTTTGPHNSSLLNKLDPRVDSDRDGSRTAGNTTGTTGSGYGSSTTGMSTEGGYPHHTTGLAAAEIITELKPGTHTVDHAHHSHNLYMSDKVEDYQAGSNVHTRGDPNYSLNQGIGSTNTSGPHNSNVANKLDPRVDSDNSSGYGNTGTTGQSGYGNTGNTGTSGYGNTGNTGSTGFGNTTGTTGTSGYGNTNTSGPHNSNAANKLDPRVDSDNDGSRLR